MLVFALLCNIHLDHVMRRFISINSDPTEKPHFVSSLSVCSPKGDDTMTGDGGEYLRAEDLRELGDDSLPGQYLDGMNYLRFSLEGGRIDRYVKLRHM